MRPRSSLRFDTHLQSEAAMPIVLVLVLSFLLLPASVFAQASSATLSGTIKDTSGGRSEEHTSELQSLRHLVCRLLLEKKNRHIKARECLLRPERYRQRPRPAGPPRSAHRRRR